jgi:DNA-binding response OmpR family regulator
MSRHVLVIEQNPHMGDLLSLLLDDLGYEVKVTGDGADGYRRARDGGYDLIILDLALPGMDGIEMCRKLRQESVHTPLIMMTSRASEDDALLGLEIGADDYLVKPFAIPELRARVKAVMRRADRLGGASAMRDEIAAGDLTIDSSRRRVKIAGSAVDLTTKQFDLLEHFVLNRGHVYTRSELLDSVWGRDSHSYEHTVDSHINRLRAKIEHDPANPRFLLTVWGLGYKFNDELDA